MGKNANSIFIGTLSFILLVSNMLYAEDKIENNSNLPQAELATQCKQLFTEVEQLIIEAEKQPGIHTQVEQIKNKFAQGKKGITAMESSIQQQSCAYALVKLAKMKQSSSEEE